MADDYCTVQIRDWLTGAMELTHVLPDHLHGNPVRTCFHASWKICERLLRAVGHHAQRVEAGERLDAADAVHLLEHLEF